MKFGEQYESKLTSRITKEIYPVTLTYKRTTLEEYHTNDEGGGLWFRDKQILGTCDFSVRGCSTEKTAKAKIRNYVKNT